MTAASRPEDGSDIQSALWPLGRRLQNARREAGLTQRVVADALEVTPQTIRNWEAGRHEPPNRLRRQLADLYGTTVPEIMEQDPAGHVAVLTPHSRVDVDDARLRLARQRASLSQEQVNEQSGISRSTLGRYERGSIKPTKANLETLATLYGRPLSWFVPRGRMLRAGPAETSVPTAPATPTDARRRGVGSLRHRPTGLATGGGQVDSRLHSVPARPRAERAELTAVMEHDTVGTSVQACTGPATAGIRQPHTSRVIS